MRTIFAGAIVAAVCAANNSRNRDHKDYTVVDLSHGSVYRTQDYWSPDSHSFERQSRNQRDPHGGKNAKNYGWNSESRYSHQQYQKTNKRVQQEETPFKDAIEKKSKQLLINQLKRKIRAGQDAQEVQMPPKVPIVGDEGSGGQRPDNDKIVEPEVVVPDKLLGEDSGDEAYEPTDTTGQTASEAVQINSGQNQVVDTFDYSDVLLGADSDDEDATTTSNFDAASQASNEIGQTTGDQNQVVDYFDYSDVLLGADSDDEDANAHLFVPEEPFISVIEEPPLEPALMPDDDATTQVNTDASNQPGNTELAEPVIVDTEISETSNEPQETPVGPEKDFWGSAWGKTKQGAQATGEFAKKTGKQIGDFSVQVGTQVGDYASQKWDVLTATSDANLSLMSEPVQVTPPCSRYGYAIEAAAAAFLVGAGWYLTRKPKHQNRDDDYSLV